ncbi:MAG: hypothetical protein OXG87_11125 [Gemmatimonadetes bacterium]|nr:hypothetical protein [Gemmatimonadota bacterium]
MTIIPDFAIESVFVVQETLSVAYSKYAAWAARNGLSAGKARALPSTEDISRAVVRLTAEERQQLSDFLDRLLEKSSVSSPEEITQSLNAAFDALGEGLGPAKLEDTAASR